MGFAWGATKTGADDAEAAADAGRAADAGAEAADAGRTADAVDAGGTGLAGGCWACAVAITVSNTASTASTNWEDFIYITSKYQ